MKYDQFEKGLVDDLTWRKKELTALMFIAKKNEHEEAILKSIILLLYAHWEGYIKKSSKLYLKYISAQNLNLYDLPTCFKAIAMKANISKCIEAKESLSLSSELEFLNKFVEIENKKFKVQIEPENDFENSIIDTKSNLNPKVYKRIIDIIGLKYKNVLLSREHYIDSHLLANRNAIGHAGKISSSLNPDFSLNLSDIEKLKAIIFIIIDSFKDELLEYANKKFYLISNYTLKCEFELIQEREIEERIKNVEQQFE
jgi:hypothetical protein